MCLEKERKWCITTFYYSVTTMRRFFTTRVATADAIFRDGFTDIYEFGGCEGVYFADRQLDVNDGFEGDVTLCMDAPDEVFERHEVIEDGAPPGYGRRALIPAVVLNQIGKPKVYDHYFAGCSRRDMLRVIRQREAANHQDGCPSVQDMRSAIEFFDRIGWLTPLKLSEAKGNA